MQDLNDLYYFAKVVEHGGFTAASRLLGIPKSRLSRRIAELELRLGVRLLQRTTRKLALTDVGERYLRHCQAMLLEAEQADEAVASLTSDPQVRLEMLLTNQRVDLLDENIDVALRVRDEEDEAPSLIARKLHPAQAFIVAAPALLDGQPIERPEDLARLQVLGALEIDRKVHFLLQDAQGNRRELALEARLSIDDFAVRKTAALAGLGISMLPRLYCQTELDSGELIRLLPEWNLPGGYLQAVYTHRRGMLPAVRAWIEHLTDAFQGDWSQPL